MPTPFQPSQFPSSNKHEEKKSKENPTRQSGWGDVPLPCLPAIARISDQRGHGTWHGMPDLCGAAQTTGLSRRQGRSLVCTTECTHVHTHIVIRARSLDVKRPRSVSLYALAFGCLCDKCIIIARSTSMCSSIHPKAETLGLNSVFMLWA